MTQKLIPLNDPNWIKDCYLWRGDVLTGQHRHYCADWDDLPVDETCHEFRYCGCTDNHSNDQIISLGSWTDDIPGQ